jgi:hypothetical protein
VSAAASDALLHAVHYAWTATCAAVLGSNGAFTNGTTATPSWATRVS